MKQVRSVFTRNKQYSGELQLNYNDDLMDADGGRHLLRIEARMKAAPPRCARRRTMYIQIPNNTGLLPQANGTVGAQSPNEARFVPKATSVAGYGQVEVHVLPVVDLVGGIRYTNDHKTGTSFIGGTVEPGHARRPRQWLHDSIPPRQMSRASSTMTANGPTRSASTTSRTATRCSMRSIRAPMCLAARLPR